MLPNAPLYAIPAYPLSASVVCWALLAGPVAGIVAVAYVRLIAWADRRRPQGWRRFIAPTVALGLLGALSIPFPQLLGNGKDIAQLAFTGGVAPTLLLALLLLRPLATVLCLGSGVPGGLFTPSLALGALLGGVLGVAWSWIWPGVPAGLFAVLGAAAILAATTHGPISSVILLMELTARDRSFMLPLLLVVIGATVVARSLDARSIYDARFSDQEVRRIDRERRPAPA
jgi:H+/Cl- antiporter ClcA